METQTMIVLLAIITGLTTIIVLDDSGEELDPNRYCESIGKKMYCAKTTAFYCYPSLETRIGSKKCSEGWKELPEISKSSNRGSGLVFHCNNKNCT